VDKVTSRERHAAYMREWRKSHPGYGTLYVKAWVKRVRAALLKQLGGKCKKCGSRQELTFDHIHGRDYALEKMSQSGRLCRIKREAKQGLIQVLCNPCNARKGRPTWTWMKVR